MSGSLASVDLPQAVQSAVYDAASRLTSWGGTALSYDANGNLTSDGTLSYAWDLRNRLAAITSGATTLASFRYDALDRRPVKTISGVTTNVLHDSINPVQELSGGTPTVNLLTGLNVDEIFTRTDAAGSRAFLTDALGSTVALTDSTGAIQTRYSYEPYGKTTQSGQASGNTFQYTGRENDGTGLYYYRARYYSPAYQRFISEDPLGPGAGPNLYSYVDGNPISNVDPLGLLGTDDIYGFVYDVTGGWSPSQSTVDAVAGFGDAFLVSELIRDALDIGNVDKCSKAYKGGKAAGVIAGSIPFVARGAAWLGSTRFGHVLNHNRYFRIGPGRWGKDMVPRISSPYLPGDGHYSLTTRLLPLPPLGVASNPDCGCSN